jgi:nitrous oxidase accessory protein NosD
MVLHTLRKFFRRPAGLSRGAGRLPRAPRRRPRLEVLEDRTVPATLVVDDNLACPGATFTSIQAAVNAASAGDTISVCDGVYNETVTVNKAVALRGAQSGVDARTRSGPESVVQGPNGQTAFYVTAGGAEINGFTVQNATSGNVFGAGIVLGAGTAGSHVLNNIIQNNIVGLFLANNSAADQTVIQNNLFRNNNQPGPASGTGIYTDEFVAGFGQGLTNVRIDNNTFVNQATAAVTLGSTATDGTTQSRITISNNVLSSNGSGLLLFNLTSSAVSGNTITGSTAAAGAGIQVLGGVSGLAVTGNTISGGAGDGIKVTADFGANAAVTVNNNNLFGNAGDGLEVAPGGHTGTLNAERNWWGAATGPNTPGADRVNAPSGAVDFTPWLLAPVGTATVSTWKDAAGNLLVVDTATGNYTLFLADGTALSGTGARVQKGVLKIHDQSSGGKIDVTGSADGTVGLNLRGKNKRSFTLDFVAVQPGDVG